MPQNSLGFRVVGRAFQLAPPWSTPLDPHAVPFVTSIPFFRTLDLFLLGAAIRTPYVPVLPPDLVFRERFCVSHLLFAYGTEGNVLFEVASPSPAYVRRFRSLVIAMTAVSSSFTRSFYFPFCIRQLRPSRLFFRVQVSVLARSRLSVP